MNMDNGGVHRAAARNSAMSKSLSRRLRCNAMLSALRTMNAGNGDDNAAMIENSTTVFIFDRLCEEISSVQGYRYAGCRNKRSHNRQVQRWTANDAANAKYASPNHCGLHCQGGKIERVTCVQCRAPSPKDYLADQECADERGRKRETA